MPPRSRAPRHRARRRRTPRGAGSELTIDRPQQGQRHRQGQDRQCPNSTAARTRPANHPFPESPLASGLSLSGMAIGTNDDWTIAAPAPANSPPIPTMNPGREVVPLAGERSRRSPARPSASGSGDDHDGSSLGPHQHRWIDAGQEFAGHRGAVGSEAVPRHEQHGELDGATDEHRTRPRLSAREDGTSTMASPTPAPVNVSECGARRAEPGEHPAPRHGSGRTVPAHPASERRTRVTSWSRDGSAPAPPFTDVTRRRVVQVNSHSSGTSQTTPTTRGRARAQGRAEPSASPRPICPIGVNANPLASRVRSPNRRGRRQHGERSGTPHRTPGSTVRRRSGRHGGGGSRADRAS